ncbi:MAG: helix-turn-helix domain-containing protein [Proteobacteria bacterium]|nr:helix-turn-helix domain-containing protein [Pseudomonadota bacterium]
MSRRACNPRRVKIHRNYSVEDAAKLLHLHKNTIREWIRHGLPVIDDRRPVLILGSDLSDYLARRRSSKKRPCGPGQIYCVRCRCPQHPAGDMADYEPITTTSGNLVGLCPACNALMYRRVNCVKLDAARGNLEVSLAEAQQHIVESSNPSVNRDFTRE